MSSSVAVRLSHLNMIHMGVYDVGGTLLGSLL